jgi:hypothetical protein
VRNVDQNLVALRDIGACRIEVFRLPAALTVLMDVDGSGLTLNRQTILSFSRFL